MSESCLIQKLSYYVKLNEAASKRMASLEEKEETYEKGVHVYGRDDRSNRLFVVKSGWLYTYTDLPDGRRQIIRIHHPGDIVGFPDIAFHQPTTELRTAERVTLCPFDKKALQVIFVELPQITALLFSLAVREEAIFIDLLRAMGRMSAREKIGYLLLDLWSRLKITNSAASDTFRLPLNQSEIGDAIGLTNVYVSKTMTALEEEGLIRRVGTTISLTRPDRLARLVDFTDRYVTMDTTWFPMTAG